MGGATTGFTVGGPWGAAIGGVAGGLLGGFMGGGSKNTGLDQGAIDKDLADYLAGLRAEADARVANVGEITKGLDGNVKKYSEDYSFGAAKSENTLSKTKANLDQFLLGSIDERGAVLKTEVGDAIGDLAKNYDLINQSKKEDIGKLLDAYAGVNEADDAKLQKVSDDSLARLENTASAENTRLEDDTFAEADRAKNEQMSLGDKFLANITASQQAYQDNLAGITENLRSGTPSVDAAAAAQQSLAFNQANLGKFTSMADSLSKAALQTRSDMLATADPRALEMSQIADNNASAMMSGRISADVQANLARSGAFKALNGGFGADSSMGRNLQARDLGLTSLDLMGKGDQMYRDNRQLNYDTRVNGLQVDGRTIMANNGLSSQQALDNANKNALMAQQSNVNAAEILSSGADNRFNAQNNALGLNYGNNFNAIGEESTQRLNTYDNIYGTNLKVADEVRGQTMGVAKDLRTSRLNVNNNLMNTGLATVNDISGNYRDLANTSFNAATGVSEKVYNTGANADTAVYGSGANMAGTIYQGNMGMYGNIFSGRTGASTAGARMQTDAELAALGVISGGLTNIAGTSVGAAQQNSLNNQANNTANSQTWASIFNSGASLAGTYLGSKDWNANAKRGGYGTYGAMQNDTISGTTGSYLSGAGWVPKATAA